MALAMARCDHLLRLSRLSTRFVGRSGLTRARHNSGQVSHTAKYGPWRVKTYVGFGDEEQAIAFEKYLKSGSGRAFAKRHFS